MGRFGEISKSIEQNMKYVLWMAKNHPYETFETVLTYLVPVILIILMFQWRVRQSMKKYQKISKQRENLLKKLNASRKDEEEDEVVAEAIRQLEERAKKSN